MNNKTLISLLFATCTLITTPMTFANSPAMDDADNANMEPAFIDAPNDARPAETDADADNKDSVLNTKTETIETGTVLTPPVQPGDSLLIPKLDFPRRGMSEEKVQNELGRPNEIRAAVGKPPISQWLYDDRIVYFERSSVVHVVAR